MRGLCEGEEMNALFEKSANPHPKILRSCELLEKRLVTLGMELAAGIRPHETTERFVEIYSLIESLPLSNDEFMVVRNRLRNVVAYLHSGERRASLFELHSLTRVIRRYPDLQLVDRCEWCTGKLEF